MTCVLNWSVLLDRAAAAMLHLKAFVKKTAGGQVHRIVKEHYVRDDIECALCCTTFAVIAQYMPMLRDGVSSCCAKGVAANWIPYASQRMQSSVPKQTIT